jgi:hypothetical protein
MSEETKVQEESALDEGVTSIVFQELKQGYREWEIGETKYRTRFATPKEEAESRWEYSKAFNRGLVENLPTEREMLAFLEKRGLWTAESEKELASLRQKIDTIEAILAKKSPKDTSKSTRKLAEELLGLRLDVFEKSNERTSYLSQSVESLAEEARTAYLIALCTVNEDGTPVWATAADFMGETNRELVNSASYEYMTFTNGLAENYLSELTEVKFIREGKDEEDGEATSEPTNA